MTGFDMSTIAVLIALIVSIGIFFLGREIFAWYAKINQRIDLDETQLAWLVEIAATNEKILIELRRIARDHIDHPPTRES